RRLGRRGRVRGVSGGGRDGARTARRHRASGHRRAVSKSRRLGVAVTVYIPTSFRRATNHRDRVEFTAVDVSRLLDQLEASYGGLKGLVGAGGGGGTQQQKLS